MLNIFDKSPAGRYWLQVRNAETKRWLLVCSREEYKQISSHWENHLSIGEGRGCPKNRVILAEAQWSFKGRRWLINVADGIDLWESVIHESLFADELIHVLKFFPPLMDDSPNYLQKLKDDRRFAYYAKSWNGDD
jgi:hypothetical protein